MMVSSLSPAAAAVRVLSILYILFSCFCFLDVAVASPDVTQRSQSQPQPQPQRLRSPLPSRPRAQLQRAVTAREENGGVATPPADPTPRVNGFDPSTTGFPGGPSPTQPATVPFTLPASIVVGQTATIGVRWPTNNSVSISTMVVLCQTSATDISLMTSDNTWIVLSVDFQTLGVNTANQGGSLVSVPMTFEIPPEAETNKNFQNFFFCWGFEPTSSGVFECETYSETFDVQTPLDVRRAVQKMGRKVRASIPRDVELLPRVIGTPTAPLTISTSSVVLSIHGSPTPLPTSTPTPQSSLTTVTQPLSTTTKYVTGGPSGATSSPTSGADANSSSSSKSKLGTGPIVGIAVGGVVVILLVAFLAFTCVRRRRNDSEAKHLLLHDGSAGSRERVHGVQQKEKHISSTIPSVPMLSFLETRPSSGPFDHLELSEPYSGPAAPMLRSRPPSTAVPGAGGPSKTNSTLSTSNSTSALLPASSITGLIAAAATATANSPTPPQSPESPVLPNRMSTISAPLSPRSTLRSVSTYSVPYTDVPSYGETRHTPQLYESPSQTPFLSEPGMSEEELTRLEEEERRIDEAIAEAEAAGRR